MHTLLCLYCIAYGIEVCVVCVLCCVCVWVLCVSGCVVFMSTPLCVYLYVCVNACTCCVLCMSIHVCSVYMCICAYSQIRTLENKDTHKIHSVYYDPKWYFINWPGKSGHLDRAGTHDWSQDVHNTQVLLYVYVCMHVTEFAKRVLYTHPILWLWRGITSFISQLLGQNF